MIEFTLTFEDRIAISYGAPTDNAIEVVTYKARNKTDALDMALRDGYTRDDGYHLLTITS